MCHLISFDSISFRRDTLKGGARLADEIPCVYFRLSKDESGRTTCES